MHQKDLCSQAVCLAMVCSNLFALLIASHRVFRQKDQSLCFRLRKQASNSLGFSLGFVDLLNQLRLGRVSVKDEALLKSLGRKVIYDDGIEPTCLYPKREQVSSENRRRLTCLKTKPRTFVAHDFSGLEPDAPRNPFHPDPAKLKDFLDKVSSSI